MLSNMSFREKSTWISFLLLVIVFSYDAYNPANQRTSVTNADTLIGFINMIPCSDVLVIAALCRIVVDVTLSGWVDSGQSGDEDRSE